MKKIFLLLFMSFTGISVQAQKFIQIEDKAFNFGAKVGVNSTFPIVNSLRIDDVEAENIRLQYKVGYQASIFCRINIDRFFIQPDLSWYRTEGDIFFSLPETESTATMIGKTSGNDQLKLKSTSLELPVMIGYYLVKEGPYALSMMVGPKLKYNYKLRYTTHFSELTNEYINDNTPFGIGIAAGLGVSIWRLFFEFTYEFGINQIESDFKDRSSQLPVERTISIDKRTNMMSFSLGFLF
ncbi:porin family protein [uncultured Parabacteroides sp.]|uniref:porin family protein n=1 Tax=uncultured Parabacteroides sp. TaxID=512312 RepID=UPI002583DADD|nr:porin family protein [uncultured Parabacteroides sp.]